MKLPDQPADACLRGPVLWALFENMSRRLSHTLNKPYASASVAADLLEGQADPDLLRDIRQSLLGSLLHLRELAAELAWFSRKPEVARAACEVSSLLLQHREFAARHWRQVRYQPDCSCILDLDAQFLAKIFESICLGMRVSAQGESQDLSIDVALDAHEIAIVWRCDYPEQLENAGLLFAAFSAPYSAPLVANFAFPLADCLSARLGGQLSCAQQDAWLEVRLQLPRC